MKHLLNICYESFKTEQGKNPQRLQLSRIKVKSQFGVKTFCLGKTVVAKATTRFWGGSFMKSLSTTDCGITTLFY